MSIQRDVSGGAAISGRRISKDGVAIDEPLGPMSLSVALVFYGLRSLATP